MKYVGKDGLKVDGNGVWHEGNLNPKIGSIPLVVGTQTVTTASWTGVADTVGELYDGLTIRYWLPRTSASNVTLNLTIKGGSITGAIPCYYGGSSRLTTHYAAGNIILLTYVVGALVNGVARTGWYAHGQYNSTYSVLTEAEIDAGTATTGRIISGQRVKYMVDKFKPTKLSELENDIGAGAGLKIIPSATEPSGLLTGDWWYEEV